jgi:hypothetical protein
LAVDGRKTRFVSTDNQFVTKPCAGLVIFVAVLQIGVFAQGGSGDLWIGVISRDVNWDRGADAVGAGLVLNPAAALVDGAWWMQPEPDPDQIATMTRVGTDSDQKMAFGKMPAAWSARLFNGRRENLRTSGSIRPGAYNEFAVSTNLSLPIVRTPNTPPTKPRASRLLDGQT